MPPPVVYAPPSAAGPPASSEAVAALVCGIGAWCCFPPVGFVALWLGTRARRAVRENPGAVGGDQMALAGMILGGVAGGLFVLLGLVYAAVAVAAAWFALR